MNQGKASPIPLLDLTLPMEPAPLPGDVRAFLSEADRRVERFYKDRHVPGFVPCDFVRSFEQLRFLADRDLAPGNQFCEWGSGLGVVTCLAAMLGFDASGIEIDAELVDAARALAEDFDVPVEFFHGSFIPEGSDDCLESAGDFAWLTTEMSGGQEESALGPADYDVIFAYPWPDEEQVIPALFERHAGVGALLLTYHGLEDLRLRRKVARPRRRHTSHRPHGQRR